MFPSSMIVCLIIISIVFFFGFLSQFFEFPGVQYGCFLPKLASLNL